MKTLIKNYELQIENAKSEYDIKSLMIKVSQDCSSYKLSWEAFLDLRKKIIAKGKKLGSKWVELC